MRPALFITMLMLLPLVQGLGPTVPGSNEEGTEYLLELEEGVWSQELWDSLASTGHTPLRMVSPNQVLVWRSTDFTSLSNILTQEAPDTEYKWGFEHDVEFVKVVFEPRLPADAVLSLVHAFQMFGIDIESDHNKYSKAIPHIEIIDWESFALTPVFENLDGVLWVEPVVSTESRNVLAGSLLQHGKTTESPAWELGINGAGVVVAAADSGIDYDHACFRNATSPGAVGSNGTDGVGSPGVDHRKILTVNHTIDSGDTNGHSDYRHGTHVAGTLTCYNVYDMRADSKPKNGSALAYQSNLKKLEDEYAKMLYYTYRSMYSYDIWAFIFSSSSFNQAYKRVKYLNQYSDNRKNQAQLILNTKNEYITSISNLEYQKIELNEVKENKQLLIELKKTWD